VKLKIETKEAPIVIEADGTAAEVAKFLQKWLTPFRPSREG